MAVIQWEIKDTFVFGNRSLANSYDRSYGMVLGGGLALLITKGGSTPHEMEIGPIPKDAVPVETDHIEFTKQFAFKALSCWKDS